MVIGDGLFANAPLQILALQSVRALLRRRGLVEQPTIGPPMHARRFLRKRVEEVRPTAEPHTKLLRFPCGAIARGLGLARVGQPTALAARKEGLVVASVQLRDAPTFSLLGT